MVKPFHPHQPQKRIMFEITAKELQLILEMRKYHYGRFLVHKAEKQLVRFEVTESILLEDEVKIPYSDK